MSTDEKTTPETTAPQTATSQATAPRPPARGHWTAMERLEELGLIKEEVSKGPIRWPPSASTPRAN
ncbi:Acyl-CoA carboxylase subunit beta OS=Streptomyces microflavus OX=1919 GN=G3I39_30570 PE=4 SV=1 [Streptomyces microflavus]